MMLVISVRLRGLKTRPGDRLGLLVRIRPCSFPKLSPSIRRSWLRRSGLLPLAQASIEAVKTLSGCPWLTVRTSGTHPRPHMASSPLVFENGWTGLRILRHRQSI